MANLFDCCNNVKASDGLQSVKQKLKEESDRKKYEEKEEFIHSYKKTHIFTSYEDALNWLEQHPGKPITWHAKTLIYQKDKGNFKSYEQEYSCDGVMCYDVVKQYTRQNLLDQIEEHQKWMVEKYPEYEGKKFWLDEYGKLSNVYI